MLSKLLLLCLFANLSRFSCMGISLRLPHYSPLFLLNKIHMISFLFLTFVWIYMEYFWRQHEITTKAQAQTVFVWIGHMDSWYVTSDINGKIYENIIPVGFSYHFKFCVEKFFFVVVVFLYFVFYLIFPRRFSSLSSFFFADIRLLLFFFDNIRIILLFSSSPFLSLFQSHFPLPLKSTIFLLILILTIIFFWLYGYFKFMYLVYL